MVFLLAMELEMFPKSCCDVLSQTLPTLGHRTSTKELVLDVKKNSGHIDMLAKDLV